MNWTLESLQDIFKWNVLMGFSGNFFFILLSADLTQISSWIFYNSCIELKM